MLTREIQLKQLAVVALIGGMIGVITFTLGVILNEYVFVPINCQVDVTSTSCADALSTSHNVALIAGAVIGMVFLKRRSVYRPLLVVVAAGASLWGVVEALTPIYWLTALALTTVLAALCYCLFAWLAVFKRLWVAIILAFIMVLVLRLVFMA